MYPPNLFWWIGGTAVLLGLLGILGMFVWWLDERYQRHIEKHHGAPKNDDDGRSGLWYVFEVLSAVFVVTGLLVAIYSDSQAIRAIAGVALIVVVAAATYAVMEDQ